MASQQRVERLIRELLSDAADPMAEELRVWLTDTRRFRAFVEAHRDKIRKKLRGAADVDARRDVRAELRVAQLLLADRRIALAFEAYGSGKRGPDFTVAFAGERSFNLEVTRLRRVPDVASLGNVLSTKLRQLPPSAPNAVLVAVEGGDAEGIDVTAATRALRARADAKDTAFLGARGFAGPRGFYERYLRLSGVLVWSEEAAGESRAAWWTNRSARIVLPPPAVRACVRCLRAAARQS